jgi:F0F1-type ATP synthase delta subunit
MITCKHPQLLANALLEMSVDGGLPSEERGMAVVRALGEAYSGKHLRRVLSAYLKKMELFIAESTLKIEHCGELPESMVEEIGAHFEKLLHRKLFLKTKERRSLIAGLRITVADVVLENSVASVLHSYGKRFDGKYCQTSFSQLF